MPTVGSMPIARRSVAASVVACLPKPSVPPAALSVFSAACPTPFAHAVGRCGNRCIGQLLSGGATVGVAVVPVDATLGCFASGCATCGCTCHRARNSANTTGKTTECTTTCRTSSTTDHLSEHGCSTGNVSQRWDPALVVELLPVALVVLVDKVVAIVGLRGGIVLAQSGQLVFRLLSASTSKRRLGGASAASSK